MTTISQAKSTITQGIYTKSKDLLVLESSTIKEIRTAYTIARNEVAQELHDRYNLYIVKAGRVTEKQLLLAQTKLFRDAQLYENLEARIAELGGKVDKITASAIMEASGISNEWVKREFEGLCAFTNLDPASFAMINHYQAEVAINKVNEGTKFINDIVKRDTLKDMRQQMRIGLLKGESIDDITQRLISKTPLTLKGVHKGVFSSIEQRARLNARWGVIESANSAAVTQYGSFNARVSNAGMKEMQLMKQVTSMIDNRTSETCIYANGQIQPIEKPFETDQGNLDYPPFHCNCRTTVTAWHKAFEAYGKSTKDMMAESKAEVKKRGKKWTKKNKGKIKTKKQVMKRKADLKAGKKAMKATGKTQPPNMQMPTKAIQNQIAKLPPKDAASILDLSTNAQRNKALSKMQMKIQQQAAKLKKVKKVPTRGHLKTIDSGADKATLLRNDAKKMGVELTQKRAFDIQNSVNSYAGYDYDKIRALNKGGKSALKDYLTKKHVNDIPYVIKKTIKEAKDIEEYIKYAPRFTKKVKLFRGVPQGGDVYKNMQPGSIIDFQGTSSFSSKFDVASKFGSKKGCIFELKEAPDLSASIKHLARFAKEEEVLISKQVQYRIISTTTKGTGKHAKIIIKIEAI